MSKCIYCGHSISDGEVYCTNCGAKVEEKSEMTFKKEDTNGNDTNSNTTNSYIPPEASKTAPRKKDDNTPLSLGMAIGFVVLMCIPGVNLIMAIIWACGASKNRNLINLSRASLIVMIVVYAIMTIATVSVVTWFTNSNGFDTFVTEVLDDMNRESGGALSQFGIDSFEDVKEFAKMDDEQRYSYVNGLVDGKLSEYGINDYEDLKNASDDGSLEKILEENGYNIDNFKYKFDDYDYEKYGKSFGEKSVDDAA